MPGHKRKIAIALPQALQALQALSLTLPAAAAFAQAPAATDNSPVTTIPVTAQNRKQEAQAVPISFQILNADQLDKLAATSLSSIEGYIPGLSVDGSQPTQPIFFLRGVGNRDFGIGTDSPVGVYVDGVYTGKSGGALLNFNDVERIEVLKGPQGTLFGRNSAGGAISIVSKTPTKDFEFDSHLRLGNYGLRYLDAVLNVPLNDSMALRMSAVNNQSDGQFTDAATGTKLNREHSTGTRVALLWNAPQSTRVLLSWEHEELSQPPRLGASLIKPPAAGAAPPFPADPGSFVDPRRSPLLNDVVGALESRRFDGITLRVERPLGWADFTSTTAYRHFNSLNIMEEDGTNRVNTYLDAPNIEGNTTWQQEFKLAGKNALADWVGGVSWFHEAANQTNQVNINTDTLNTLFNNVAGFPVYGNLNGIAQQLGIPVNFFGHAWQENILNRGRNSAKAVYGDVIWHLSPKLDLTTGIRFTHDEKEFSWLTPNRTAATLDATLGLLDQQGFFPGLVQAGAITAEQAVMIRGLLTQNQLLPNANISGAASVPLVIKKSWNDISPRAVLAYHSTPDVMWYGSLSKGYQAGGFNAVLVGGRFEPEKVVNLELGLKSYFRDYKLLLNASLFAYKFTNLQSLSLIPNGSNSGVPSYQVSSSDQRAKGLDLELRWQPSNGLKLYLASEYINHNYGGFTSSGGVNLSGQAVGTPRFSAATGLDYVWRDVASGKLNFTLQHAYTGATRCNADSVQQGTCLSAPGFSVGSARNRTDGRLGWNEGAGRWGVALFVNNLFDKRYVYNVNNITAALGTPFASLTPGRTAGLELNIRL